MTTTRAAALLLLLSGPVAAIGEEPTVVSRWRFEAANPSANEVEGAPAARIEGAQPAEGKQGAALAFADWSVADYLKPDPAAATRVVVPDAAPINPALPFRVTAWIHPTADPVYYGGIVEKGDGFGASYRLVLLRGMRISASLGGSHATVRSPDPVVLNAWHEVTLLADRTSLALVVNGREVARTALSAEPKTGSADPIVIGDRFTGRIDEVTIAR